MAHVEQVGGTAHLGVVQPAWDDTQIVGQTCWAPGASDAIYLAFVYAAIGHSVESGIYFELETGHIGDNPELRGLRSSNDSHLIA
jgi:hypothetical protein